MISLKRYIESNDRELVKSTLDSFRATLAAMGNFGVHACPYLGGGIQESLLKLRERLAADAAPNAVAEVQQLVEQELNDWSQRASDYFKQTAGEVRDLMLALARTAEAVGERDQRYAKQFSAFSSRLHAIADLRDLSSIKSSLVQNATELKNCVDQMAHDSELAVAHLRSEVSIYQARLEQSERLAYIDPLTGVRNRRKLELDITERIEEARVFCAILLDINDFKAINDQLGHAAGDDLLKQFINEVGSVINARKVVGRWGGDEFLILLDCDLGQAKLQADRIRQWAFGDYKIAVAEGSRKVKVSAAMGIATWNLGDSAAELIARADAAMYKDKAAPGKLPTVPAPASSH